MKRTFIIGYGSLLKRASLNRTLPEVEKIEPIYLNNYARSWSAYENQMPTLGSTFLGVDKLKGSRLNGIVFEVENSFVDTLDKREFLYTRHKVNLNDIEFTSKIFNISSEDDVWIYITKEPSEPSKTFPIIQSYVDICLSGCFELEKEFSLKDFAKDFINTTDNWSFDWINDRIFPRAPHIHQPDAYRIDILLNEDLPSFFKKIEVE